MAGFQWEWDEGNKGDFGSADYYEALKRGGKSKKELMATKEAVFNWAKSSPMGKEGTPFAGKSAFFNKDHLGLGIGDQKPEIGYTGFGNLSAEAKDWQTDDEKRGDDYKGKGWYTEADLLGGLAEGQSYTDISSHFADINNLWKLHSGSDVLKMINEGKKIEDTTPLLQGVEKSEKLIKQGKKDFSQLETDLGGQIKDLTGEISTLEQQAVDNSDTIKDLQSKFSDELKQLSKAAASVRQNAPRSVGGAGSATGIRFAKSPQNRGSLSGLTRAGGAWAGTGPTNKLTSLALEL